MEIIVFFYQKHPQLIDEPSCHLWKQTGNKQGSSAFHVLQAVSITTVTFVSSRRCVNECVNTLSWVLWLVTDGYKNNLITTQKQRTNTTATTSETYGVDRWGPGPHRIMENLCHSPPGWPMINVLWSSFREELTSGIKRFIPHRFTSSRSGLPYVSPSLKRLMKKRDRVHAKGSSLQDH